VFRHLDTSWIGFLTLSDAIALVWSATPFLILPLLFWILPWPVTRALSRIITSKRPEPTRVERSIWFVCAITSSAWGIAVAFGATIGMSSDLFKILTGIFLGVGLMTINMAVLVSQDLPSFLSRGFPVALAALIVAFDIEGFNIRDTSDEARVRFENGASRCLVVVFIGERSVLFWDNAREEAVALDRDLLAAVTKSTACGTNNSAPRVLSVQR
jgi:hypothetical protein